MTSRAVRSALALSFLVGVVSLGAASVPEHLALVKSEPGADSTVSAAPTALRLFWTEAPQLPTTAVRLTTAANQAVVLGAAKANARDAKITEVPVTGPLVPGVYTVTWRTTGEDGHVLNGTYKFTYRATH